MAHDPERTDGDVLGEEIGDDGLPGIGDFPPDQALGVNDPNLVGRDDVAMRDARTRADAAVAAIADDLTDDLTDDPRSVGVAGTGEPAGDLVPPAGDDGFSDRERQALAEQGVGDDATAPAEVNAVRIDPA